VLSAVVVYKFGWSLQAFFGVLLTWVLIALSFIDFDHKLLPDEIVLPTLWLGLGISLWPVFTLPQDAIIGAIAGYLSFWIVFQVFLKLTGKEGMGHGDFKLMGLLGAWLGWAYLPQIILISTVLGSIVGISLMLIKKASGELAIPFGPYIALAGWIAMLWGNEINNAYLIYTGLQ
jgi:leader peptidase (prepilin peptidase)/N-methyltransferase